MYVGSSNSDELNIKNAVFDSNTATNGGAIYTLSTELVIEGSTLMNNVANFLLAMCYYENIVDEKKDLKSLLESKNYFQIIIERFPNTDYSLDAKYKLDLIQDNLILFKNAK